MDNTTHIDDIRIKNMRELPAPQKVLDEMPVSDTIAAHIVNSRKAAEKIIHGGDDRLLVIVGPCSIHDTKAALEYGRLLALAAKAHEKRLHIIMRMYFEKPRTTIGWKGLINDPYLNGTYAINDGLRMARRVLLELNGLGLPCGTEFLDIISPQYFADLISWGAIGARTTESQSHRELASGLSCPWASKTAQAAILKLPPTRCVHAVNRIIFYPLPKRAFAPFQPPKATKAVILFCAAAMVNPITTAWNKPCKFFPAPACPGG